MISSSYLSLIYQPMIYLYINHDLVIELYICVHNSVPHKFLQVELQFKVILYLKVCRRTWHLATNCVMAALCSWPCLNPLKGHTSKFHHIWRIQHMNFEKIYSVHNSVFRSIKQSYHITLKQDKRHYCIPSKPILHTPFSGLLQRCIGHVLWQVASNLCGI